MVKTDDTRWAAVLARDTEAEGVFVYAVLTTGVYCRPSCPSRRPKRENVRFFALAKEAREAGFRPCKRCKPDEISTRQKSALAVERACRALESADHTMSLGALAAVAGQSPHHFHRVFKEHTGVTPKQYADAVRLKRTQAALQHETGVARAAFTGGFASLSRFYDQVASRIAMTPGALSSGGSGEVIVTAQGVSRLGIVTAAFSRLGICAVRLTDEPDDGLAEVRALFGNALLIDGGDPFRALLDDVVAIIEEPNLAEELPLDIRGTAFEERVWSELRKIPVGTTATYGEIAAAIGAPRSHRAVAKACGSNRIAVLVPCHRVVRADGSLAGYRWGVERKRALLDAEQARESAL